MTVDVLELARTLVRRRSVTPNDAGCQALIASLLGPRGFSAEPMRFGDVDNLWLRRGTGRPVLVFAGHTDVVPPGPEQQWVHPPFAATVRDGKLIGRGAADMKGSLAAMVKAAERFAGVHADAPGTIALLLTSDEEGAADDGTLKVLQRLAARGELFDYCIVGEPSSSRRLGDTVRIGRRGSLTGMMTVRGVQGHVAYPLEAENPMHAFARFVTAITREPIDAGNEHFPPTSFQMVNVHADAGAPNVVPDKLDCRFNFRYSTAWSAESLARRVEAELARLGIDYTLRWRVAGKPFLTREGRLTQTVCRAVEEELGLVPALSTSGGTSDGRFIAPYGIDVVELGPLNATIHQVDEGVSVDDLMHLERIYFRIAELLLCPDAA